ncbi:hypothetical protein [Actinoalloteichus hymeniacidonis]|uniref:Uncharacterized protein n=1 Tax=Actinoalloteichus hymeniacidonis TaxID=340345 RepID=A0AAC9HQE9_9PSEU|nr:hypothetical protein [Actinoalloteichus hymeniacidonis]AOS63444.1 hypothetical protein TL08_13150 [Actinoalloteichus hymeniacidonis]MBB5908514.1 membrane protein implicated in regulation of membrane protease activity [Actinoalloteichus hymeniacidonis]
MDTPGRRHRVITAFGSATFMTLVFALLSSLDDLPLTELPLAYLVFFGFWIFATWVAQPWFDRLRGWPVGQAHRSDQPHSGES